MKTFEEFIEEQFMEGEGAMILDDELPDARDAWMQDLDVDEWLMYGERYRDLIELKVYEDARRK